MANTKKLLPNASDTIKNLSEYYSNTHNLIKAHRPKLEGYSKVKNVGHFGSIQYAQGMSGLYIPLNDERVLYDHFELSIVDNYLSLAEIMYEHIMSPVVHFLYRNLGQLGITQAGIMFSNKLSRQDKDSYRLSFWLTTLLYLCPQERYNRQFAKLLNTKKDLLSKDSYDRLLILYNKIKSNPSRRLVVDRELASRLSKIENTLFKQADISKDDLFIHTNILAVYHNSSNLLHSNHISLAEALSTDTISETRTHFRHLFWLTLCNLYLCKSIFSSSTPDSNVLSNWENIQIKWLQERDTVIKVATELREPTNNT